MTLIVTDVGDEINPAAIDKRLGRALDLLYQVCIAEEAYIDEQS
jgi:hypothetical protein